MTESLDEVLTEWYKDENFRTDLADVLGGDKNDARLSAAILKMYEYTRSHPFQTNGCGTFKNHDGCHAVPGQKHRGARSSGSISWRSMTSQSKLSHSAYRLAAEDPDLEKAYCTALGADIDKLSAKLQAMEDPETCRFSDLTITFDKLGSFRGEDPACRSHQGHARYGKKGNRQTAKSFQATRKTRNSRKKSPPRPARSSICSGRAVVRENIQREKA